MNAISLENVRVEHAARSKHPVIALDGVHLEVAEGQTFGFLGPNGAGKTTAIKTMLGFVRPSAGRVQIFGLPPGHSHARARIGFLPETCTYYDFLTAEELLTVYGRMFGLGGLTLRHRITELLDQVGVGSERRRLLRTYSKGMMQRVGVAQALINDPDLLILDEPTSGLDPLARVEFRRLLHQFQKENKTVFFSSHELSEVETVADHICILKSGKILASGSTHELIGRCGGNLERFFLSVIGEGN